MVSNTAVEVGVLCQVCKEETYRVFPRMVPFGSTAIEVVCCQSCARRFDSANDEATVEKNLGKNANRRLRLEQSLEWSRSFTGQWVKVSWGGYTGVFSDPQPHSCSGHAFRDRPTAGGWGSVRVVIENINRRRILSTKYENTFYCPFKTTLPGDSAPYEGLEVNEEDGVWVTYISWGRSGMIELFEEIEQLRRNECRK